MTKKLRNYKQVINNIRFSLELEVSFPRYVDITQLRLRYRKLLGSWTCTTENSVENCLELKPKNTNHLHFNKESFKEIGEILYLIRKYKGRSDDKNAGLHIHLDAKNFNEVELMKILKEMMARQEFIIRDFKVRKDRLNKYCKRIKKNDIRGLTFDVLKKFREDKLYFPNIAYLSNKYFVLNFVSLKQYSSIEFRLFNGVKYLREIQKITKYLSDFLITALERE